MTAPQRERGEQHREPTADADRRHRGDVPGRHGGLAERGRHGPLDHRADGARSERRSRPGRTVSWSWPGKIGPSAPGSPSSPPWRPVSRAAARPARCRNTHSGAPYARLETIARATQPVIARHGFLALVRHRGVADPGASAGEMHLRPRGRTRARLPPRPAARHGGRTGKANKTPIQGIGSTITYARRYLILQVFNIALTNDPDDTDGAPAADASEDVISDAQAENAAQPPHRARHRPGEVPARLRRRERARPSGQPLRRGAGRHRARRRPACPAGGPLTWPS